MSTISELEIAVAAKVEDAVASLWGCQEANTGGTRRPHVVRGKLPPKTADAEHFPFISVVATPCRDSASGSECDVRIRVGAYSDTPDGHAEATTVLDTLRLDVLSRPRAGRFVATPNVTTTVWRPEEQPDPHWFGDINTTWTMPRIVRESEDL